MRGVVGWCDGAGLTSSAGASYLFGCNIRARAYSPFSRCGWGCSDIFSLVCHFPPLSPSLWYRLKYSLNRPLSAKQPTNQRFEQNCRLLPFQQIKKQMVQIQCIKLYINKVFKNPPASLPFLRNRLLVGWSFWVSRPFETVFQPIRKVKR